MIREDETQIIIDLYNRGFSYESIGKSLGRDRKTIGIKINSLKQEGRLKDRPRARMEKPKKPSIQETRIRKYAEQIMARYDQGLTILEISREIGLNPEATRKIVNKLIAEGLMKERSTLRGRRSFKRAKRKKGNSEGIGVIKYTSKEVPSTLKEGQTIKCTPSVARTCVYGGSITSGLCRYSQVTGKSRLLGEGGCKMEKCTKYSKISRSNPKLVARGE